MTFDTFLRESVEHQGLWEGIYRLARIPDWALDEVTDDDRRRLLVIVEDWCGDASSTIPILAKWAAQAPGLELRIIKRDEHPAVMDRYLTNGARAIPIVIVLDETNHELGHWGPRPAELQSWVRANRDRIPKDELYPQVRRWYARDRGVSTLCEVAAVAGLAAAADVCR
ncbi:MAG: thioredoxin family protein [Gemmatimonadetes bacterium]|nr:thioredoxin family protein [Gemmatimonadota bacterium]